METVSSTESSSERSTDSSSSLSSKQQQPQQQAAGATKAASAASSGRNESSGQQRAQRGHDLALAREIDRARAFERDQFGEQTLRAIGWRRRKISGGNRSIHGYVA